MKNEKEIRDQEEKIAKEAEAERKKEVEKRK